MRAPEPQAREWTEQDDAMLEAILFVVSGLCRRHGQFVADWTGRCTDPVPLEARCPAAESSRCLETSPVYVLV